jgi:hypothetical protein
LKLADALARRLGRRNGGSEAEDGSALEAIEALTAENRLQPDAKRESRLVRLRNEAFRELEPALPDAAPEMLTEVPTSARTYELVDGMPTVDAGDLNPETIRAAFLDAGALLVRGLLDANRAAELKQGIDKAFDGRDAYLDGAKAAKTAPWFEPFTPAPEYRTTGKEWNRHVKGGGSVWAADSPRMMFELLDAFEEVCVPELARSYLGEQPVFSMKKAVLRRVSATSGAAWHQDGAFLGENIRTLNIWVALTRCGDESPGMDIVTERLDEIVPTGTEGALFDWAVSDTLVEERFGESITRPVFDPGDALLFDHVCLHRTAAEPEMERLRYATETWCFAPSTYPGKQIPIVV